MRKRNAAFQADPGVDHVLTTWLTQKRVHIAKSSIISNSKILFPENKKCRCNNKIHPASRRIPLTAKAFHFRGKIRGKISIFAAMQCLLTAKFREIPLK